MRWMFLAVAASLFSGQGQEERQQRMRLALASPEPRVEELMALRTARIDQALRSPERLWQFVTLPEPFYVERRAAAVQGRGSIPVEWVPRLWRAIGELRSEQQRHRWGLKSHPLSAAMNLPSSIEPERQRRIFGHGWSVPDRPIEYPLTREEREQAPWPWQVQVALGDLYSGLIPNTYAPLERDKAEAYLAAVLTMPCTTDEEAQWFVEATQSSSHFKTPAIMAALRNIGVNPALPGAAAQVSGMYADATRLWDDPRAYWIGYAGILNILRKTPHAVAREGAAYQAVHLREAFRDGAELRRPIPAAVILDMSRRGLTPDTGSEWKRLYTYVFSVVAALDEPPFQADRGMSPESPMVSQRLGEFRQWYEAQRSALEDLARQQQRELDEAERVLAGFEKCL